MVDSAHEFESLVGPWRSEVETALAAAMQPATDCPPRLREAMAYSLLAGGKRLRPLLTLMACEACGSPRRIALPAACAIEMVHTYSLIHDDLPAMDNDDYRRGRLTNHKVFGEGLAILAGDALLTLAFEILAREIRPAAVAAGCVLDLAAASGDCGMVAGQVADLEAENSGVKDVTELEAIHRRKTGRLLTCALTMGARIAQAAPEDLLALQEYGVRVGLAFQITDDLLDVSGDPQKLGKGVGKDAGLGKLTYPSLLGDAESRQRADALIVEACELVHRFGDRGRPLIALAQYVGTRDR